MHLSLIHGIANWLANVCYVFVRDFAQWFITKMIKNLYTLHTDCRLAFYFFQRARQNLYVPMRYRWHISVRDKSRWNDKIVGGLYVEISHYHFLNSSIKFFWDTLFLRQRSLLWQSRFDISVVRIILSAERHTRNADGMCSLK